MQHPCIQHRPQKTKFQRRLQQPDTVSELHTVGHFSAYFTQRLYALKAVCRQETTFFIKPLLLSIAFHDSSSTEIISSICFVMPVFNMLYAL